MLDTYKDRPDSAQPSVPQQPAPSVAPPQPPMQSEAPKVPEAAVPHNDAVAEYQAMLDTYKDIQDSRGTASEPKPPIESPAGLSGYAWIHIKIYQTVLSHNIHHHLQ